MRQIPKDLCHAEGREIAPIKMGEGSTGVLLIHGYLATPEEMRVLAQHLAAKGLRVYAPMVAGHGTTMREFRKMRWEDWYASVESALAELQRECSQVFVVGISLPACKRFTSLRITPGLAASSRLRRRLN